MTDYLTTDTELTSIANAIRSKGGTSATLEYPADFIAAINAIPTGGSSSMQVGTATAVSGTGGYIQFVGLNGQPTSFAIICGNSSGIAPSSTPYVVGVVYDGTDLHAQTITNTNGSQVSYNSSDVTMNYTSGDLYIASESLNFDSYSNYMLVYTYGGTSANIDTKDVQVGSGATSITFTGLSDEPACWSCIFKSNFSTSSGYQRVIEVVNDGSGIYGLEMDSSAKPAQHWTASYSNGSLTITSNGTNQGGYFHQPGYYQLTYGIGGEVEPPTVEPLNVTQNGTYAETGKAYSPVTVNVPSGGSVNVATTTWSNSSNTTTSHQFTGLSGTPKAAFLRCTSSLSRSSNSSNYFIADMVWDGSTCKGNSFRRSNGTYANVTSGYSVTTGSNSITFTSSGTSTTNPGSFYNGTYELVYVY